MPGSSISCEPARRTRLGTRRPVVNNSLAEQCHQLVAISELEAISADREMLGDGNVEPNPDYRAVRHSGRCCRICNGDAEKTSSYFEIQKDRAALWRRHDR